MILPHHERWPEIHETAFIAPSADVIGEVKIGSESSVWFQCVIRGDVNHIAIGSRTNIQDHSMLHVTHERASLSIGDDVTVGHRVLLHGCRVNDRVLVGMGAVVMDHAEIGSDSVIGAGALVTEKKKFPPRSMILGAPARVIRELTDEEVALLLKSSAHYVKTANGYRNYVQGPKRLGADHSDLETFEDMGDLG